MFRKALVISFIVVSALLVIFIVFIHVFDMEMDEEETAEYFSGSGWKPALSSYEALGKTIHYVEIGDSSLPLVVFVHGSPGSWSAFSGFLRDSALLSRFHMISIDRPGFGGSEAGKPEPSLAIQAGILKPLIERKRNGQPVILAGHSYGGPVIVRFAADYPDLTSGLLILAGSVDPDLEKTMWIQWPLSWRAFRWIIPEGLDVSNREILPLRKELEAMLPAWERITAPTLIIQGGKDKLVPAANGPFAKEKLQNAETELQLLPDENHFFIWTKPGLVRDALIKLEKMIEENGELKP
jgi:pimeloyl-ACP methyl ester carboxylesterase